MGPRPYGAAKTVSKGYIVLVAGKLKEGQMAKFQEIFAPLAAYVAENEDGCLAYELSVGADDPDRLIIYERYVNAEYVEKVHWQSPAFKAFQAGVREAGIEWLEKSVTKLYEADVGFA